jgi:hypothetical protein
MPEHPDVDPDEWGGVALEAHMLVHSDRAAVYPHPADDYSRVVDTFNALTDNCLTAAEGAIFMQCVKLVRAMWALENDFPPELWRDTRVDGAGYWEVLDAIVTYEAYQLEDDDDDDDDGGDDTDEPTPEPLPDGDADEPEVELPLLVADTEPIDAPEEEADDDDEWNEHLVPVADN